MEQAPPSRLRVKLLTATGMVLVGAIVAIAYLAVFVWMVFGGFLARRKV